MARKAKQHALLRQRQLGACETEGQCVVLSGCPLLTCSQAAELSWPRPGSSGKKHVFDKQEVVSMDVERRNDRAQWQRPATGRGWLGIGSTVSRRPPELSTHAAFAPLSRVIPSPRKRKRFCSGAWPVVTACSFLPGRWSVTGRRLSRQIDTLSVYSGKVTYFKKSWLSPTIPFMACLCHPSETGLRKSRLPYVYFCS